MLEVREMRKERQSRRATSACSSSTMKLTPELLTQAPSSLNPIKERQLDLRGRSYINVCILVNRNIYRIQNSRNRKPRCDQGRC